VVPATIAFIDNQVDKQTGAITLKVLAENADEVLWPGQAVEVALTVEVRPHVLAAPASAVLPSQKGMMAWVIGPDNKVEPRVVTIEGIVGQKVFLGGGLAVGDRVVTDGQIRLAPGMTVTVEDRGRTPATNEDRRADGRG
jgi:RND family efflux transporter MFP subunit